MKFDTRLRQARPYLMLLAASAIIAIPALMSAYRTWDYTLHYRYAAWHGPQSYVSHALYPATIRLYDALIPPLADVYITFLATLTYMLPLPLALYWLLQRGAPQIRTAALMAASIALTLATAVTLWTDNQFMIGYFTGTVYHNPTYLTLRVFIAPMFVLATRVFAERSYRDFNERFYTLALTATMLLLTTLGKQSYAMALLPGACIFAMWRLWRRRGVDWTLLIFGICVPGTLLLLTQSLVTTANLRHDFYIGFGFFEAFLQHVPLWRIPLQLALSLVFPGVAYWLYRDEARKHSNLNLAWTVFGAAAAIVLFMHTSFLYTADLGWTGYAAAFALMFATMAFLLERATAEGAFAAAGERVAWGGLSRRMKICLIALGLHVASGLAYYARFMTSFESL